MFSVGFCSSGFALSEHQSLTEKALRDRSSAGRPDAGTEVRVSSTRARAGSVTSKAVVTWSFMEAAKGLGGRGDAHRGVRVPCGHAA